MIEFPSVYLRNSSTRVKYRVQRGGVAALFFFPRRRGVGVGGSMSVRTVFGAGWIWLSIASAVHAQSVTGATSLAEGAQALDVVVVTETGEPRRLNDLAISLSRLEADELVRIRADHFSEVLDRVPGAYLHRGNGQEHLTAIRSPILTGGAGAGSFLFLQDGVGTRAAGFANVNGLFETHSEIAGAVEVVRGPGGVLYGSNAVHGLINVLTRDIGDAPGAAIDVSGSSFGRYKGNAWANGRYGGHGFFAGVSLLNENGFRDDSGVDQQKLTLKHQYEDGRLEVSTTMFAHNINQETAGFVLGDDAYRDPELRRTNPFPEAFRDARAIRLTSRWSYAMSDDLTLTVTPYARWNEMDFLLHFLPSRALEENGHWSVGAKSAIYKDFSDDLSLTVGVDVEHTEGYLREEQIIPTVFSFTQGLHYDYEVDAIVAAPFAQGEWAASDRLRLSGGIRLDFTDYSYDNLTASDRVGRFIRPADRSDDFTVVTAKAGAVYDVNDRVTVYTAYARGGRPPQTTDLYRLQLNQTVGEIDAESIDSIEGGLRGQVGVVSFDMSGYVMQKRNFFFRDADGFNVVNGKTRHAGAELGAQAALSEALTLDLNLTYGRHTYRFNRPANGIVFGAEVDTAPSWLANGRVLWSPASFITSELEWVWVDDYFTDPANRNSYPGHNLFNLRVNVQASEQIELFGAVRNLTDKAYAERADFAFGNERYFTGEDRAFTLGARARF